MLCKESSATSKYSTVEFVSGHQASSPASRAFHGTLPCNEEVAVMLLSDINLYSNPTAMLLHVSLSASWATKKSDKLLSKCDSLGPDHYS